MYICGDIYRWRRAAMFYIGSINTGTYMDLTYKCMYMYMYMYMCTYIFMYIRIYIYMYVYVGDSCVLHRQH